MSFYYNRSEADTFKTTMLRSTAFFAAPAILLAHLFSPAHGSHLSPSPGNPSALDRIKIKRQEQRERERKKYLIVGDVRVYLESARYFKNNIWTFRYSKVGQDSNRNPNRNAQIWSEAKVAQKSFIPKLAIDCQNMSYSVLRTGREWGDWYLPSSNSDEEQILAKLCDLKEAEQKASVNFDDYVSRA